MFNQINPIFEMYCSRILQGRGLGFHTLISLSNSCKDSQFLIFRGTMAHILGPRNLKSDRLDAIVCRFYIFPPELVSLWLGS